MRRSTHRAAVSGGAPETVAYTAHASNVFAFMG